MTLHNKQASVGYLLHSFLRTEFQAHKTPEVAKLALWHMPSNEMDNYKTKDLMEILERELILEPGEWGHELHYSFDVKTVEEAEDFFITFTKLYPFLKQHV